MLGEPAHCFPPSVCRLMELSAGPSVNFCNHFKSFFPFPENTLSPTSAVSSSPNSNPYGVRPPGSFTLAKTAALLPALHSAASFTFFSIELIALRHFPHCAYLLFCCLLFPPVLSRTWRRNSLCRRSLLRTVLPPGQNEPAAHLLAVTGAERGAAAGASGKPAVEHPHLDV